MVLLVEDGNASGEFLSKSQVMGSSDYRFILAPQFDDEVDQPGLAARIKADGGFIEQPDIGIKA